MYILSFGVHLLKFKLSAQLSTTHEPLLANYAVIEPVNARAVHYTESAHATKWPT